MQAMDEEEEEITVPGVYLWDRTTECPKLVPVGELAELDAEDLLAEEEEIPVSIEVGTDIPTNPRFSITSVSGVISVQPNLAGVPADKLYRKIWYGIEDP